MRHPVSSRDQHNCSSSDRSPRWKMGSDRGERLSTARTQSARRDHSMEARTLCPSRCGDRLSRVPRDAGASSVAGGLSDPRLGRSVRSGAGTGYPGSRGMLAHPVSPEVSLTRGSDALSVQSPEVSLTRGSDALSVQVRDRLSRVPRDAGASSVAGGLSGPRLGRSVRSGCGTDLSRPPRSTPSAPADAACQCTEHPTEFLPCRSVCCQEQLSGNRVHDSHLWCAVKASPTDEPAAEHADRSQVLLDGRRRPGVGPASDGGSRQQRLSDVAVAAGPRQPDVAGESRGPAGWFACVGRRRRTCGPGLVSSPSLAQITMRSISSTVTVSAVRS